MLCASVATEIEIPAVVLLLESKLVHTFEQNVESFFTLASADDLSDTGNEKVHCGNGLSVVVQSHIEGLYFLRIIYNEYRLLEYFLGEISLMLGLEVASPFYRVLELLTALLKKLYRFCISNLFVIACRKSVKPVKQGLVNKAVEEFKLCHALVKDVIYNMLYHIPGKLHIIVKVSKSDLGLYHPELCRMTRGVGVFRAEGRAEGINVTECHSVCLALKLSRNRKVCALSEEVLRKINASVLVFGRISHIESSDSEHFARALTVRACDKRGMNIYEASVMEELVDSEGYLASYTENSRKQIRSRAQICDLTQEFKSVSFLLQGVIGS